MRIGVSTAYWPWITPDRQLEIGVLADELGLDSVWCSEAWGQDAVSMLGLLAGRTEHVRLGTAIMQIPARKATATAMAAASVDVLSGGRMMLGLGPSGPQVSEGWYGEPFARPLARTRAYVETVRTALAGETLPVQLPEGESGTGLAKELRLLARPVQPRIPIYLGATSPKGIEQCGQIADGWIGTVVDPLQPAQTIDLVVDAVAAAGRERTAFDVACLTPTAVAPTEAQALDLVRPWVAFYLGAMGAKDKNFYVDLAGRYGYAEAAGRVQDLYLAGDRAGAAAALPDDLLRSVTIACDPAGLPSRLAAFADAGVDTLIAVPGGGDLDTVRALAAARAGAAA
ncbi:Putative coenzyme F420-dependent oxidoreductase [Paraconexibacter sp. AEG42_29]|uniref:Coenzyme F420-dependent oxidoreductase n=1 Tax=Paraconexibacter sp. AEG42_29 TaxID=2997339 RepID=A0AAU7B325_9ACTN